MMILIIELTRSIKYGKTGHANNRRRYQEEKLQEAKRVIFQEEKAVEEKEETLEMLCKGMIRKVMCFTL